MRLFFADTEASFYVTEYDGDDGPLGKETIRPGQHDGAHKGKVQGRAEGMEDGKKARGPR